MATVKMNQPVIYKGKTTTIGELDDAGLITYRKVID